MNIIRHLISVTIFFSLCQATPLMAQQLLLAPSLAVIQVTEGESLPASFSLLVTLSQSAPDILTPVSISTNASWAQPTTNNISITPAYGHPFTIVINPSTITCNTPIGYQTLDLVVTASAPGFSSKSVTIFVLVKDNGDGSVLDDINNPGIPDLPTTGDTGYINDLINDLLNGN